MNYKIHNAICITDADDRNRAKTLIKEQIPRIEKVVRRYPKNLIIDFYFNQDDRLNYSFSALINLKEGLVFVKEKGQNIEGIVFSLFDKLKLQLSKKIHKERKVYLRQRRRKRITEFIDYFPELKESKKEESIELSNQLLGIILSEISEYIDRRLKSAEVTSAIKRGRFKVQEILDEIYLIAYNKILDLPEKALQNTAWIYHITDEYLEELFQEVTFEEKNITRLRDLVNLDYSSNQELYSTNNEHELIPNEGLETYEELSQVYMANDLFWGDTESSILDEITLKLNQQQINDILKKEINKLPLHKRTIIDLFLIEQLDMDEISYIKNMSQSEVEEVINEVCKGLEKELLAQL